jgi:hypothetical protein
LDHHGGYGGSLKVMYSPDPENAAKVQPTASRAVTREYHRSERLLEL